MVFKKGDSITIGEGNGVIIKVSYREYKAKDYIDIRKWYFNPPDNATTQQMAERPDSFYAPTAKGISLTPQQFIELMDELVKIHKPLKDALGL